MLKLILVPIILTIGFSAAAGEPPASESSDDKRSCDRLLTVPARFRNAFSVYTDQRFLLPVAKFDVKTTFLKDLRRDKVELFAILDTDEFIDGIGQTEITADIENFERTINVNDLEISREFGEEYGLKLLLAHYLDRYPEIERVEMSIFRSQLPVTYSILKEGLARGMSLHQALESTPAVLALKALGFTNFGSDTRLRDGPGNEYSPAEFEIWLDMRKQRDSSAKDRPIGPPKEIP